MKKLNQTYKDMLIAISKNPRYTYRYIMFIESYMNKKQSSYEKHHILPRCLYPEYIKSKWNIIKLPARAHYIAHYLLYKADIDSKLTFAFNMMSVSRQNQQGRASSKILNHSKSYSYFRESLKEAIRNSNSNNVTVICRETNNSVRVSCDEYHNNRDKYIHPNTGNVLICDENGGYTTIKQSEFDSLIHKASAKDTVVVKDASNHTFRVSVYDPRYISGELIPHNTGKVVVTNANNERVQISCQEYKTNKDIYTHHSTNTVIASDENGVKQKITKDEYLNGNYSFHTKGKVVVKNKKGEIFSVSIDDPDYVNGNLTFHGIGKVIVKDKNNKSIFITSDEYKNNKDKYTHASSGFAMVKDKDNNILKVSLTDERYINGELVGMQKGTVTVKDLHGNKYRVSLTDERYLSGEFIAVSKGLKWYHNPANGDRKQCDEGKQPEGYIKGMGSRNNS